MWSLLAGLVLAFPALAGANALVRAAWEAGTLDMETALLYQVYAVRDTAQLPEAFRQEHLQVRCATPMVTAPLDYFGAEGIAQRPALKRALARPEREYELVSSSGYFRVHYNLTGRHAVDAIDADGNGVPDYVDHTAAIADSMWVLEIEELGYRQPPTDGGLSGGDEYDIYISSLGGYGFTYPDVFSEGGTVAASYMEIDNDYTDSIFQEPGQAPGLDGLRITLAHEFFHMVQFGYYYGRDHCWWQEATATWMEEVAYPQVDNYLVYLPSFFSAPDSGIDRGICGAVRHYGGSILPLFMAERYGRETIRTSWEEFARRKNGRVENLEYALPEGLAKAISEFALWNYFTGDRHRAGQFYSEGNQYPLVRARQLGTPAKVIVQEEGRVDRLASQYIRLEPALMPGGVVIELDLGQGPWRNQLLLISTDSLVVRPIVEREIRVSDWDAYDEVVLVLTTTDAVGFGGDYRLSVQYDPDLSAAVAPVAFHLKPVFPNPLVLGTGQRAVFPFALDLASQETRLSIYTVSGQLVRHYELGGRAQYRKDSWDGRNAIGQLVHPGIYYYVLEADGRMRSGKIAVVRK